MRSTCSSDRAVDPKWRSSEVDQVTGADLCPSSLIPGRLPARAFARMARHNASARGLCVVGEEYRNPEYLHCPSTPPETGCPIWRSAGRSSRRLLGVRRRALSHEPLAVFMIGMMAPLVVLPALPAVIQMVSTSGLPSKHGASMC
jgi:hypothetical protein